MNIWVALLTVFLYIVCLNSCDSSFLAFIYELICHVFCKQRCEILGHEDDEGIGASVLQGETEN